MEDLLSNVGYRCPSSYFKEMDMIKRGRGIEKNTFLKSPDDSEPGNVINCQVVKTFILCPLTTPPGPHSGIFEHTGGAPISRY